MPPQRLFYRPPRKWPRIVWGATIGMLLAVFFLRLEGYYASDVRGMILPVALAIPGGAIGGYLYAMFDPLRARGQAFLANIVGGLLYLFAVGVAYIVGMNGPG